MTVLDDELIPQVLQIVNDLGISATFAVYASQTYSPDTGKTTQTGSVNHVKKVTPPVPYNVSLIDGENIRKGDAQVWIPASGLTFTPTSGITVTLDGKTWTIVDVDVVYTGEMVALYGLQLRR